MNKSDWIWWIPFLDFENGIESHRKYIKLIRILFSEDAEDEYEEEKINLFNECECRYKINYVRLCELLNKLFISLNPQQ